MVYHLSSQYRYCWPDISHDLLASYNYAFQHGTLSISQRRQIISLIPKKSKDKTILENLRPISLLNADYKILVVAKAWFKHRILHAPNLIAELSACKMPLLNQFNSADLY